MTGVEVLRGDVIEALANVPDESRAILAAMRKRKPAPLLALVEAAK